MLSKHLPDPSITDGQAACAWDSSEIPGSERPGEQAAVHCSVRPLNPSEAHEVSKTVYKAYGYSYPHDYVYYPEKIAELNRRGEIFSAVAFTENQEVVGHCSLKRWEENPQIAEMTQGVGQTAFPFAGILRQLTDFLIEAARRQGLAGVFGEAVTTHPYSQRTAIQFGLRLGRLLRRLRLDELPQLWNVFRGEMSFVGPRPERAFFVDQLRTVIPFNDERHSVKPGVTGWAQVKFHYGSSLEDAEEKLEYDLYYIKHMSWAFDVGILVYTAKVLLFGKGAR